MIYLGGTILILMDFNVEKRGREMEMEVPWGSKKRFHQPLLEERKAKEAKRKVVLFLQLGQVGSGSL